MENQMLDADLNSNSNIGGLTTDDKNYLDTAGKWARFLGIVGFVFTGFMLLVSIFMFAMGGAMGSALSEVSPIYAMTGMGAMIGFLYLLFVIPFFLISLYTYRFGTNTKSALYSSDAAKMTEAFKQLRNLFRFYGWLTAIILGLYALIFIFAIGGAAFMGQR
jgi:cell division protein FtsX